MTGWMKVYVLMARTEASGLWSDKFTCETYSEALELIGLYENYEVWKIEERYVRE